MRSDDAGDLSGAICLVSGASVPLANDGSTPQTGQARFYLIRVVNECPGSAGTLGTDSSGVPRTGPVCP